MSEKRNDINHLATKSRILAALSGKTVPPVPPVEAIEADEPSDEADPDSSPGVELRGESYPSDDDGAERQADPIAPPTAAASDGAIGVTPVTVDIGDGLDATDLLPVRVVAAAPAEPLPPALSPSVVLSREGNPGLYAARSYIASRVRPKTKRTMAQGLKRIARLLNLELEQVQWHELRFEHCDAVRAQLLDGRYAPSTVRVTLQALTGVLHQCKRLRLMNNDDFSDAVDLDKVGGSSLPPGRELTQSDLEAIQVRLNKLEGSSYGAFLEVVFSLTLGVGLRASEVGLVTVQGVDLNAGRIRLQRKGAKEHEVPLGDPEVEAIRRWLDFRRLYERRFDTDALLLRVQPNDWVREGLPLVSEKHVAHICRRMAAEAKIAPFTPHDLRRTCCTRAIRESGGDLAMVQELMAHEKIETTKRYDRRGDEERAAARRTWNLWRPPPAVERKAPPPEPERTDPELPEDEPPTPPSGPNFRVIRGGR